MFKVTNCDLERKAWLEHQISAACVYGKRIVYACDCSEKFARDPGDACHHRDLCRGPGNEARTAGAARGDGRPETKIHDAAFHKVQSGIHYAPVYMAMFLEHETLPETMPYEIGAPVGFPSEDVAK